jgi:hypothetical protein
MGAIQRTVTKAMGMATSQCRNQSPHEIKGECMCVTVNVIMPVAVMAVSNCNKANFML